MGRIFSFLIMIGILLSFEMYIFNGLKALFKNGIPRNIKWIFWVLAITPFIWISLWRVVLQDQIGDFRWLGNIILGIFFTLLITKAVFAIFLLIEDIYRVLRFSGESILSLTDKGKPTAVWESRRRFIAQMGIAIASVPFMSFLYGVTRGKYAFTVHRHTISFTDLPDKFDGFKIVQISDIHSGSFDNFHAVARGVNMIQEQNADLILFTGDLVNNRAEEIEPYIHLFEKLKAPYGKFSVLGNHDYGSYIRWGSEETEAANMNRLFENHKKMGFRLLNNESITLDKEGYSIRLAGVENWGKGHFPKEGDLNKTFYNTPDNEFTILMSHDPSHWTHHVLDFNKHIHLTLSGHTHGMQMGIEIPGIKWSPSKWIYPHWAGLYQKNGKYLYVNRGFGFLGFPGRVGILPEITVIELKKVSV